MTKDLENQIVVEEEEVGHFRSPDHFAYPTFAKAARQRADNLQVSIRGTEDAARRRPNWRWKKCRPNMREGGGAQSSGHDDASQGVSPSTVSRQMIFILCRAMPMAWPDPARLSQATKTRPTGSSGRVFPFRNFLWLLLPQARITSLPFGDGAAPAPCRNGQSGMIFQPPLRASSIACFASAWPTPLPRSSSGTQGVIDDDQISAMSGNRSSRRYSPRPLSSSGRANRFLRGRYPSRHPFPFNALRVARRCYRMTAAFETGLANAKGNALSPKCYLLETGRGGRRKTKTAATGNSGAAVQPMALLGAFSGDIAGCVWCAGRPDRDR